MASSASNNNLARFRRKGLIQPILPALPLPRAARQQKSSPRHVLDIRPTSVAQNDAEQPEATGDEAGAAGGSRRGPTYLEREEEESQHAVKKSFLQESVSDRTATQAEEHDPIHGVVSHLNGSGDIEQGKSPEPDQAIPTLSTPDADPEINGSRRAVEPRGLGQNGTSSEADEKRSSSPHTSRLSRVSTPDNQAIIHAAQSEATPRLSSANTDIDKEHKMPENDVSFTNGTAPSDAPVPIEFLRPANTPNARNELLRRILPRTPLPPLSEHLLQAAASKEWADWIVMVNTSDGQPVFSYAHGLVLTRSPRLRRLMQRQQASNYTNNTVNIYPPRPIIPHALEAALRFLYSDAVLSVENLFPKSESALDHPARPQQIDYIISYWVAGMELGLDPVAVRAAVILEDLLQWDALELVMKEAQDFRAVSSYTPLTTSDVEDYLSIGRLMMQSVLRFLITHLDVKNFRLDPTATTSLIRSRFTHIGEIRPKPNPVLASMVFGSMPSSAELSPASPPSEVLSFPGSPTDAVASNILLNLDFDDLAFFCHEWHRFHSSPIDSLLRQVVEERESRRLRILSNRSVSNKQRLANAAGWEVAASREFFKNGSLERERVGFLLPSKH